jgi:hypothetical protein
MRAAGDRHDRPKNRIPDYGARRDDGRRRALGLRNVNPYERPLWDEGSPVAALRGYVETRASREWPHPADSLCRIGSGGFARCLKEEFKEFTPFDDAAARLAGFGLALTQEPRPANSSTQSAVFTRASPDGPPAIVTLETRQGYVRGIRTRP